MARHRYCWVLLELLTLCLVASVAQDSSGTTDPYILLANGNFIQEFSLDGSHRRAIITNPEASIIALDYDFRREYVFWTDRSLNTITRAGLDGSNPRVITTTSLRFADGLAWDWVSQKLYWIEWSTTESMIVVLDPLTGLKKVLFSSRSTNVVQRLRSIVVDPSTRLLYWSDWSGNGEDERIGKIERSSLDGQNRETIHEGLGWPAAMTVDYENQMLYWVDVLEGTIERSFVDGTGREILLRNNSYNSFLFSTFQGQLYLSNVAREGGIGLFTVGARAVVPHTNFNFTDRTYWIQVVSSDRQAQATNLCAQNNAGCSHLCLLSAASQRGFTCFCPDELALAPNMRTCVDPSAIVPIPTTTILGSPVSTVAGPDASAIVTTPKPTSEPETCRTVICQNGGTCQNQGLEYICVCIDGYGGRNCEFSTLKPKNDDFTISAAVFVGVVAGLVLIIFLMFIAALCVFGSMKRRKASLDGSNTIINRQTVSSSMNDHDYMSIRSNRSNRSSPAPKSHYYITLPGASNESSPRESGIQDSAVKVDPTVSENFAYALRSKVQTL